MSDYEEKTLRYHRERKGKIELGSKVAVETAEDLSLAYTPGVAHACQVIASDPQAAYELTSKSNTVAVISDGSAVLGLGNIGPLAALPVMEGKALLMKQFGGLDAWPICIDAQDPEEIIQIVSALAPSFGAINLEDISAPRCFAVERALQDLGIPVFHDDQHGTAMATLAALLNAAKVVGRDLADLRIVICGAGAAGVAITELLSSPKYAQHNGGGRYAKEVILCDSRGILSSHRTDLNAVKQEMLGFTNHDDRAGSVRDALVGADVFIGVSAAGLLSKQDIQCMNPNPIILAMANPHPEIMPDEALAAGASVVATGRSDLPNQVNNVLIFPGFLRGLLDMRAKRILPSMWYAAAHALADTLPEPTPSCILPRVIEGGRVVSTVVAEAVRAAVEVAEPALV